MKHVNLYEAKTHLSKLVTQVEEGGEAIVLCRNGKPVVDLIPHDPGAFRRSLDPALSGAFFTGDPCAEVAEEDWPAILR